MPQDFRKSNPDDKARPRLPDGQVPDLPDRQAGGQARPVENMITCPDCGMVYDTRFLAEYCRMVDGEGYRCRECNALLVSL